MVQENLAEFNLVPRLWSRVLHGTASQPPNKKNTLNEPSTLTTAPQPNDGTERNAQVNCTTALQRYAKALGSGPGHAGLAVTVAL